MSNPKVLYIEDNEYNRLLVKRVLMVEDIDLLDAPDGPTGIELAKHQVPDLILMDINLPEIDGYELTALFKSMPGFENVPVIALTANVMKGDREKTLAAGCDGYIQKPIDVDRLPQQIRSYLKESGK